MGLFSSNRHSNESDSALLQGLDLSSEIAEHARDHGQRQREAAAHEDINNRLDEVQRRGLFKRS